MAVCRRPLYGHLSEGRFRTIGEAAYLRATTTMAAVAARMARHLLEGRP